MVKFVVALHEATPEREKIIREMLAQAFGDNYTGYIITDKHIYEDSFYTKQFIDRIKPDMDLVILEGKLEGIDKYHPYEYMGGFNKYGIWAFWADSTDMSKDEACERTSKLISNLNLLREFKADVERWNSITWGVDFIF